MGIQNTGSGIPITKVGFRASEERLQTLGPKVGNVYIPEGKVWVFFIYLDPKGCVLQRSEEQARSRKDRIINKPTLNPEP